MGFLVARVTGYEVPWGLPKLHPSAVRSGLLLLGAPRNIEKETLGYCRMSLRDRAWLLACTVCFQVLPRYYPSVSAPDQNSYFLGNRNFRCSSSTRRKSVTSTSRSQQTSMRVPSDLKLPSHSMTWSSVQAESYWARCSSLSRDR